MNKKVKSNPSMAETKSTTRDSILLVCYGLVIGPISILMWYLQNFTNAFDSIPEAKVILGGSLPLIVGGMFSIISLYTAFLMITNKKSANKTK